MNHKGNGNGSESVTVVETLKSVISGMVSNGDGEVNEERLVTLGRILGHLDSKGFAEIQSFSVEHGRIAQAAIAAYEKHCAQIIRRSIRVQFQKEVSDIFEANPWLVLRVIGDKLQAGKAAAKAVSA